MQILFGFMLIDVLWIRIPEYNKSLGGNLIKFIPDLSKCGEK